MSGSPRAGLGLICLFEDATWRGETLTRVSAAPHCNTGASLAQVTLFVAYRRTLVCAGRRAATAEGEIMPAVIGRTLAEISLTWLLA